ncbi:MAG: oxidoreductase [Candidatus Neomarinimicrobiota bacterium]
MELNFEIPDLTGKIVIVTGANSGIGLEETRTFAAHGATVIMACRNMQKAQAAADDLHADNPQARLAVRELNLASLESVRNFTAAFQQQYARLDILCNNAGVMALPEHYRTDDGFEMQFGTNHLGHFALTGLLLPLIKKTPGARVVNVSSMAHHMGRFDPENLNAEKKYSKNGAYGLSKLANLLFTYELQRHFGANNIAALAVATHPGWTATNLQQHSKAFSFVNKLIGQTPTLGALPTIMAATDPVVNGGEYYGPGSWGGWRGLPTKTQSNAASHNQAHAQVLWDISEKMTGVKFDFET